MMVHDFPWWVSVVLAGLVYGFMRWVCPHLMQDNAVMKIIFQGMAQVPWLGGFICLIMAGLAFFHQRVVKVIESPKVSASAPEPRLAPQSPGCPLCGNDMVQRQARRGATAGRFFWGCSGYPACKGTRD